MKAVYIPEYVVGGKVEFIKTGPFWFLDMIANGDKLTKGQIYTVSEVTIASSWTGIKLVETGEARYAAHWFKPVKEK